MLLKVDLKAKHATRVRGSKLKDFGLDERAFQDILFRSLDRLIPDDELLLLMQSRRGPEEPDLMALDKDGKLYIFELKAWEARSENLLQVLRYGQLFGNHKYDNLEKLYQLHHKSNKALNSIHEARFELTIEKEKFNSCQVFVVITNGIDFKTREAVKYWRSQGLDVRPWIYRVYKDSLGGMSIEISSFSIEDNPYEDLAEGYYILNTNIRNSKKDHDSMLHEKIAAAYFAPPKHKIENLSKGDIVFLYQSGVGIIAVGRAADKLNKRAYQGNSQYPDDEYYRRLNQFHRLSTTITASEIKNITGVNHRFMSTMFGLDADSGKSLYKEAISR
jgi:hypothetical protein